jgi:hypothetical protein
VVPRRDVFVRPSQYFGWVVESRKPDGRVTGLWLPTKGIAKAVGRRMSGTELEPRLPTAPSADDDNQTGNAA